MSPAATFQRLREEFERGWLELDGKRFTIHIFTPSFSQAGHCPFDPNWEEILPFDRKTDKLIGSVHMPYSADTDDRENFTATPGSVVVRPAPSFIAAKDAPLFASTCELFKKLCNEAGAALQEVIRRRLVGYCSWECSTPASWWFALLANMTGKTVYHSDGTYNDHNFITGPWELSIRLIDHFGLNTDSPTWPEEVAKDNGPKAAAKRKAWLKSGLPPAGWHQTPLVGELQRIANWLGTSTKTLHSNNGQTHWIIAHIGCDPETGWPAPFAIFFQSSEKYATVNGKRRPEADQFLKQQREAKTRSQAKETKRSQRKRKEAVPKKRREK